MPDRDERTWQKNDTRWLGISTVLLAVLAAGGWMVMGSAAVLVVLVVAFAGIVGLQLYLYRKRSVDDVQQRRHLQALLYLFTALDVQAPLPALTGWAVNPELAATLVALIRRHQPEVVLELGSGASTVIMGYAVEQNGCGRVISLDHNEHYGAATRRTLARHGLQAWADVRHAPLTRIEHGETAWSWYDLDALEENLTIDMVFVDGPPHETGTMARYPALPALYPYLSDEAIVVLDDAYRADERAMLNRWMEDYADFAVEVQAHPNGTAILRRSAQGPSVDSKEAVPFGTTVHTPNG